ncbi:LysE family translocator [Brevirhabdus sp.]|uniref:LysE family translocator n=1 Tax=Brevirhabdus sp. TaxID=2004514 RepID=UPI0040595668
MSITVGELSLYALALIILFLTPGPVWIALTARALSGGFAAAWPLALGVVVGDVLWPLLAVLGVSWLVGSLSGAMDLLRYAASAIFLVMGVLLIRNADRGIARDSRLTRPGVWPGFAAGVAVILGNPKAILFYMGVLPGFFDLTRVGWPDIAAITFLSFLVPLCGNLVIALLISRARAVLSSARALRRANVVSGLLLILVAAIIPFA